MEPFLAKVIGFTEDALRKELIGEMRIRKGDRILEVCIGTGSNVPYFKDRWVSLIAGVDISEEMLNRYAEKFPSTYLFLACAEALPFKNDSFDRILIGGEVAHMTSPRKAFEESYRVLRSNGRLVIYEQLALLEKLMGKEDIKRLMRIEPDRERKLFKGRFVILSLGKNQI